METKIVRTSDPGDHVWFAANPGRTYRLRKALRREYRSANERKRLRREGCEMWVAIWRAEPQLFQCAPFAADIGQEIEDTESYARAMWVALTWKIHHEDDDIPDGEPFLAWVRELQAQFETNVGVQ